MRNEAKLLSAVTAILAMTVGAAAFGQNLPQIRDDKSDNAGTMFFVKNVSGVALRCAYRINNGAWSRELNFPVNYQFSRYAGSAAETVGFACRPPMVAGSNRLLPGQRYIVRKKDGQIRLVRSTL